MMRSFISGLLFFIIFILIWQIAAVIVNLPILLPYPMDVLESLKNIVLTGSLVKESVITLSRAFTGILISIIIGLPIGMAMGMSRILNKAFSPLLIILQATPVISWVLLTIIWFDHSFIPLFVIVVATIPIIILNTSEGIMKTDVKLLEMANFYKVSLYKRIKDIYIPSIIGYLIASLKLVIGFVFKVAVMAEVLSHIEGGIGDKLSWAQVNINTSDIIAWTIIIIILTYICEKLISELFQKRLGGIYD